MKEDKPDSADKWLKWDRKRIPFYPKLGVDPLSGFGERSVISYAYSFAQAGDYKNALEMADNSQKRTLSNLKVGFNQYQNFRHKVLNMKGAAKKARASANTDKQRKLQAKMHRLASQSQNISDKIYSAFDNLIIIQHIYYMAGKDSKATDLAAKVNSITNGALKFPKSKKASKKALKNNGLY